MRPLLLHCCTPRCLRLLMNCKSPTGSCLDFSPHQANAAKPDQRAVRSTIKACLVSARVMAWLSVQPGLGLDGHMSAHPSLHRQPNKVNIVKPRGT